MSDSWFSTQRWIKARNFRNSNNELAHAYPLIPCGIEQKAAITVQFLRQKVAEYETLEKEIRALRLEMDALSACRVRCSEDCLAEKGWISLCETLRCFARR